MQTIRKTYTKDVFDIGKHCQEFFKSFLESITERLLLMDNQPKSTNFYNQIIGIEHTVNIE